MKEFKYKTSFSTQIKSVISEERDKYLSLASLINIGDFIPDIDIEANVDLLPIAFNAFVANRVNKNGDVIDADTAIAIYENFLNKPINIEHHRDKVIGTILSSGFSEFGTDKPLDLEQVKAMTAPFNVTLGGVVWKVVNDEIASFIEDSSDPTSENYLKVSASWELGFSDFNIILLKNEEKNIENGEVIAEEAKIEELRDYLRVFGGKEYVDENTKAYRQVIGKVVPLGIGFTETPAADVKGVSTEKTKEYKIKKEERKLAKTNSDSNNISRKPIKNVILKENVMKIKSIKDITDESLQEMSASVVADFIEDELRKASERYTDEKEAVEKQLKDSVEQNETITKEQEELKDKLVSVEKSLAELEQEKQEREAQQRFNERMSTLDEEYKLNDEDREVIASDIKDMNNEDFESYSKKLSVLLKDKNREALAKKEEENKLNAEKEEVKASTEEQEDSTVIETVVEEAQEEDSEDIPNSTVAEEETLVQKYQKAFSLDQFEIR
jgi:hypothetical protein